MTLLLVEIDDATATAPPDGGGPDGTRSGGRRREFLIAPGERKGTDLGVLEVPEDATPGDVVYTHLDAPFAVRALRTPDFFEHFERTGAPMMPRDVGLVVGLAGVGRGDRVLDVGTGTGVLAAALARTGAEVLSYERDPDAAAVARENMAMAGVTDRVTVRTGDATAALGGLVAGGDYDVLTLDTGDAPTIARQATGLLAPGGFMTAYVPFVETVREVVEAARPHLSGVRAIETIQRELDVDRRGTRPDTAGVGHTGYLVVGRAPDAHLGDATDTGAESGSDATSRSPSENGTEH